MSRYSQIIKKFCLTVLVCALVLDPFSFFFHTKEAEAKLPVIDIPNLIQSTIMSKLTDGLVQKEYVYDGIAWAAVNVLVEEMLQSTIRWVNSGFKGSPAFVEDLEGFLIDVADRYALAFIWDGNLQALCSPFKLNIQLALDVQRRSGLDGYQATCRLTDAIKNHESFLNGDFIGGGGWAAWRDITLNPNLNAHGAYLNARGALFAGMGNARLQQQYEIDLGDGFLSKKVCEDVNGDGKAEENCKIVTPGQTIQGFLGETLAAPIGRMTIADELDELIGALINQLASNVLDNLRGVSSGGGSGQGRFLGTTPRSQHNQVIDANALKDQASAAAEADTLQDTYIDLLEGGMQLLLSCGGQLGHNQQRDLDVRYEMLKDELADVVSGKKQVTEAMVQKLQDTDLQQINRLVETMPDAAACAI